MYTNHEWIHQKHQAEPLGGFCLHLKPLSLHVLADWSSVSVHRWQVTENPAQTHTKVWFMNLGRDCCRHRIGFRPVSTNVGSCLSQSPHFKKIMSITERYWFCLPWTPNGLEAFSKLFQKIFNVSISIKPDLSSKVYLWNLWNVVPKRNKMDSSIWLVQQLSELVWMTDEKWTFQVWFCKLRVSKALAKNVMFPPAPRHASLFVHRDLVSDAVRELPGNATGSRNFGTVSSAATLALKHRFIPVLLILRTDLSIMQISNFMLAFL